MLKKLGIAALAAIVVLVGVQLFLPVHVAFATSDSMAPVIDEGDAYLVVSSGTIERGDIITFRSPVQDQYVTHRVVRQTSAGYITKGDANPTTDQSAGTPPVPASAVLGEVVTIYGQPVTAPTIGPILGLLGAHRLLVFAVAAGILTLDLATSRWASSGPKVRDLPSMGDLVHPLLIGTFLICVVLVATSGTVHDITYVATAEETGASQTIPVGESVTRTVTIQTASTPLSVLYLDTDGVEIEDRTRTGTTLELTVRVPAQEALGPHRATIGTYWYPRTLPRAVLASLHEIHWLAAAIGSVVPIFGVIAVVYGVLFDSKTPLRIRPKRRGMLIGRR